MDWLRSPILYGLVLLFAGAFLRMAVVLPGSGGETLAPDMLRRALEYQRSARPIESLEPRYRRYAHAFVFAASAEDVEAIKRAIDAELAADEEVRARGLAAVPEYAAAALLAPDIVMMALGGALLFRSLAFVLAMGFAAGGLHQLLAHASRLTGSPSEHFLGAILAALAWSVLFWAARAKYEGRRWA